ncbi:MAG: hypothetical protein QOF18_2257 [Frankiaceae bacterium]|nr:hypothetical protein [Frankiaceae bacterium]
MLAARHLAPVAEQLETALGLRDPFRDAGVGHFGLENAVYALGDTFVEIVSPTREETAAGRQLDRRGGDCGYMVMFELSDAVAVRTRLSDAGVRVVWETSHEDIVDLHLHPKDVPGAIVALDVTEPVGSWRWGGPQWTAAIPAYGAGGLRSLTIASADPAGAAGRWSAVLGLDGPPDGVLELDGGAQQIRFVEAAGEHEQGIVAVGVDVTGATGAVDIAGVRFDRGGS